MGNLTQAKEIIGIPNSSLVKTALNATGTAPIYACRAWVNFNGTGTVAIRASGNVSSITDNGVGDYTVNFTTAMVDVNYSASGYCRSVGANGVFFGSHIGDVMTVSSFQFKSTQYTGTIYDAQVATLGIFR